MDKQIFKAILDVQAKIDVIAKNRSGDGIKYKFRGIDDVYNYIQPLFKEAGIFSTSEIIKNNTTHEEITNQYGKKKNITFVELTVRYHFHAGDGSSVFTEVEGQASDYSDKAANQAMAFAHKLALIQMFTIPTEESEKNDPDLPKKVEISSDKAEIRKLLAVYQGEDKADIEQACKDAVKNKTFTDEFVSKIIEALS